MRSYGIFLNLFLELALRITNNVYLNLLIKLQRSHFIPVFFLIYTHLVCLNKRSEQNDSNYTYFFIHYETYDELSTIMMIIILWVGY